MAGSPCPIEVMKQVLTKLHMPQVTVNTEWLYLTNMTVKVFSSIQQLKSSLELNSEHFFHEVNETKLFGFPEKKSTTSRGKLEFSKISSPETRLQHCFDILSSCTTLVQHLLPEKSSLQIVSIM